MRKKAFLLFAISAGLTAFTSFKAEVIPLAIVAIACAVAWSGLLASRATPASLSIILALHTAVAAVNLPYGASIYLIGLAIVLSIMSWDWALTEITMVRVSSVDTKRFWIHHCLQTFMISGLGFGLLIIPVQIKISIGFHVALGLSMGAFMLIALLFKLLARKTPTADSITKNDEA